MIGEKVGSHAWDSLQFVSSRHSSAESALPYFKKKCAVPRSTTSFFSLAMIPHKKSRKIVYVGTTDSIGNHLTTVARKLPLKILWYECGLL